MSTNGYPSPPNKTTPKEYVKAVLGLFFVALSGFLIVVGAALTVKVFMFVCRAIECV